MGFGVFDIMCCQWRSQEFEAGVLDTMSLRQFRPRYGAYGLMDVVSQDITIAADNTSNESDPSEELESDYSPISSAHYISSSSSGNENPPLPNNQEVNSIPILNPNPNSALPPSNGVSLNHTWEVKLEREIAKNWLVILESLINLQNERLNGLTHLYNETLKKAYPNGRR
ncbi:hypothetical protein LguiA_016437 [Lonicera macranthoides]